MPYPHGIPTYEELRSISDAELLKNIDTLLEKVKPEHENNISNILHISLALPFRDELVRREQDKATQAMLEYTGKMTCMTVIITVFTFLNLAATVVLLFKN